MIDMTRASDADVLSAIHAAYPDDTVASVLAAPSLLNREVESEAELTAVAAALLDADDFAFQIYVVRARFLHAALAAVLSSGQPVADDPGVYVAPNAWPAAGCFEIGALATAVNEEHS